MQRIDYKPLSVNEAWKGQRFKTDTYRRYERDLLFIMPKIPMPAPPYKISFVFGFSNPAADLDNPGKCMIDILQKKYLFNDKEVYRLEVDKVITAKGKEFIMYKIEHYEPIKIV